MAIARSPELISGEFTAEESGVGEGALRLEWARVLEWEKASWLEFREEGSGVGEGEGVGVGEDEGEGVGVGEEAGQMPLLVSTETVTELFGYRIRQHWCYRQDRELGTGDRDDTVGGAVGGGSEGGGIGGCPNQRSW